MEVRLQDLKVGKKYKLKHCFNMKERLEISNDPDNYTGTSQVDIDTICSRFLELSEKNETYLDLRFKLPKGERIKIPEEQNRRTGTRNYIYLSPEIMEEGDDRNGEQNGLTEVAFLEEIFTTEGKTRKQKKVTTPKQKKVTTQRGGEGPLWEHYNEKGQLRSSTQPKKENASNPPAPPTPPPTPTPSDPSTPSPEVQSKINDVQSAVDALVKSTDSESCDTIKKNVGLVIEKAKPVQELITQGTIRNSVTDGMKGKLSSSIPKIKQKCGSKSTANAPKPSGNAPKPPGNAPKPPGNAPKPLGNAPKPPGNAPKPLGNAPKPLGNAPKPPAGNNKKVAGPALGSMWRVNTLTADNAGYDAIVKITKSDDKDVSFIVLEIKANGATQAVKEGETKSYYPHTWRDLKKEEVDASTYATTKGGPPAKNSMWELNRLENSVASPEKKYKALIKITDSNPTTVKYSVVTMRKSSPGVPLTTKEGEIPSAKWQTLKANGKITPGATSGGRRRTRKQKRKSRRRM